MLTYNLAVTTSQLLSFAISAVLPLLVALVSAQDASAAVKTWLLLLLSAINGFLTIWLDASTNHIPFNLISALLTSGAGFCLAVISHQGLLGPIGITGSTGVIAQAIPRGIGAHHDGPRHSLGR